jgi:polysaccharide export outer membrane protein
MRKYILFFLSISIGTEFCFAQVIPDQQDIYLKYKHQQSRVADGEIERFSTPEIYQHNIVDSDTAAHDYRQPGNFDRRKNSTGFPQTADTTRTEEPELKLFGYDIFETATASFIPDIHDLPPEGYTLGPGDNIIVNIWGRVDMELNLTIDREGKVFIPKVGELVAAGSTINQFKQNLSESISRAYSEFQLSVSYGKLRRISIYILGEVRAPGGYTVSSLANLLHALYTAGGITKNGSLRSIQLVRNTKVICRYDLYDLLLKGENIKDLKLMSGDIVYVPVVGPLVSIAGQVKRPAIYEIIGREQITDIIKLAGGINPEAFLESVSLDRIGPADNRILKNLNLADSSGIPGNNIILKDGDKVTIHSIYDFHANRVYLSGHVKHPGSFGISDTMRISHLIDNGDQLKEDAYCLRADLYRTNNNGTRTLISVNLQDILNGNENGNLNLIPFDSLVVYSYDDVTRTKYVDISGEIKRPGTYMLYNRMRLSDLIFLAGNLTKQAYSLQCEIARVSTGSETGIITVNLEDVLINNNPEADIILQEDDYAFIRQIPDWRPIETVTLEGEVLFPGKYAIRNKEERLSNLIMRAGGLTPSAFPQGAIFYRRTIQNDVTRRNIGQIISNTQEKRLDSLGNITSDYLVNYDPSQLNRIIIDLPGILKNAGGPNDIVLSDSDYIYIPTYPSGIQIIGAVAANGTISYVKNKNSKYYIAQAGGLIPEGDGSAIRLVKPNGKVFYGRRARSLKVEPGDAIVVPTKIKRRTDWGKILTTTATVIGSMATTALVIDRLK